MVRRRGLTPGKRCDPRSGRTLAPEMVSIPSSPGRGRASSYFGTRHATPGSQGQARDGTTETGTTDTGAAEICTADTGTTETGTTLMLPESAVRTMT